MTITMNIAEMQAEAHQTSKSKGWYEGACYRGGTVDPSRINVLEKLALVHSEVSEAVEAWRDCRVKLNLVNGKPEGVVVELADVVIRIGDLCGALGLDLNEAVTVKMAYNKTRPHRHGGKLA
jgi:NTP pyrophosphatase (non-canonical NTP hydrolase)